MSSSPSTRKPQSVNKKPISDQKRAQLLAEAKAPYRGLRQFFYLAFAGSAFIGGFIMFFRVLAGQDLATTLPNLGLQVAVFALMIWLYRLEQRQRS